MPHPSGCLDANAHELARYGALCQEAGLLPVIEPEVLMGAFFATVLRSDRSSPASGFHTALHAMRDVGGNDFETQYGAARIDLSEVGHRG